MHNSKCKIQNLLVSFCVVHFALLTVTCGVPNLETPVCNEARTVVREFYSLHFGNDMVFSQETLKRRERFLTQGFSKLLEATNDGVDPFTTGTDDIPKAFRVGECREISADRVEFQILLFWRDDTRSEQREVKLEAARQNEKWLVDKIASQNP